MEDTSKKQKCLFICHIVVWGVLAWSKSF